jgi:hypothetical protein
MAKQEKGDRGDPKPGMVRVVAKSPEALLEGRPLAFEPPFIALAADPAAVEFWWRSMQYVFPDLVDPRSFPPLADEIDPTDLEVLRRYTQAAEEMAESLQLSGSDQLTVRLDDDSGAEEITADFTHKENRRGFTLLLRQFDSQQEQEGANFTKVRKLLETAATASIDGDGEARLDQIATWQKARGRLQAFSLPRLVRQKTQKDGIAALDYPEQHPPSYYMSAYNYGDLIHWDKQKRVIAEWESDPFEAEWQKIAFLQAAAGLAHLYTGFGELVKAAIARQA